MKIKIVRFMDLNTIVMHSVNNVIFQARNNARCSAFAQKHRKIAGIDDSCLLNI